MYVMKADVLNCKLFASSIQGTRSRKMPFQTFPYTENRLHCWPLTYLDPFISLHLSNLLICESAVHIFYIQVNISIFFVCLFMDFE